MTKESKELQAQETGKQEIVEGAVERPGERLAFVPRTDIYETNDGIFVVADIPGVKANSVNITLEENVLSIEGSVEPWAPENHRLAYAEYRVGDYQRKFKLSDRVDRDGIEAQMKGGVLRLHLPKVQPTTKRIVVQAA